MLTNANQALTRPIIGSRRGPIALGVLTLVGSLSLVSITSFPCVANAGSIEVLHAEPWAGTEFEGQIKCNVRLSGEIVEGDHTRLREIYDLTGSGSQGKVFSGGQLAPSFLCLDSSGGSYAEALKIAKFLTGSGAIATVVEAGRSCFSACAVIFMAGSNSFHLGQAPGRWLHVRGRLGFHAPFLEKSKLPSRLSADDAITVYVSAQRAIAELIKAFSLSEVDVDRQFFSRPWVRKSLFLQMSLTGPDSLYEIDTIDRAGRWGIALFGLPLRDRFH